MTASKTRDVEPEVWRLPRVMAATSLSRTTIWRLSRRGDFPRPRRLSARCVGWDAGAVREWLHTRPDA